MTVAILVYAMLDTLCTVLTSLFSCQKFSKPAHFWCNGCVDLFEFNHYLMPISINFRVLVIHTGDNRA